VVDPKFKLDSLVYAYTGCHMNPELWIVQELDLRRTFRHGTTA
jgi:hypothetical protein